MGRVSAPTLLLLLRVAAVTMPDCEYHTRKGIERKRQANYQSKAYVHREDAREDSPDY